LYGGDGVLSNIALTIKYKRKKASAPKRKKRDLGETSREGWLAREEAGPPSRGTS